MSPRAAALVALAVVPLAAPLSAVGLSAAAPAAHVHMENIAFDPETVAILVGEAIEWDNHDLLTHTVTADDGSFTSGNVGNGGVYTRTFDAVATIPYHCDFHPSMVGTIVVSDPDALPDLAIGSITFLDTLLFLEKQVNVTVRNFGQAAAPASTTRVAYVHHGEEHLIGDLETPIVGPGGAESLFVEWSTLGKLGDFVVRAAADATGVVEEGDEGNNGGEATASVLLSGFEGIDLLDPM